AKASGRWRLGKLPAIGAIGERLCPQELARQRVAASRQSAADLGGDDGGALPRRRYGQIQEQVAFTASRCESAQINCSSRRSGLAGRTGVGSFLSSPACASAAA